MLILLVLGLLFGHKPSTEKLPAAKLSVVGVASQGKLRFSDDFVTIGKARFRHPGIGVLLELPLGKRISTEMGVMYLPRKWEDSDAYPVREFTMEAIHAPMMLRYHFNRVISIGLGGFLSPAIGMSSSYAEQNVRTLDFGITGSLRFLIRLGKRSRVNLLAEGRYNRGLRNLYSGTGNHSIRSRDILAMLGVQLSLGGGK